MKGSFTLRRIAFLSVGVLLLVVGYSCAYAIGFSKRNFYIGKLINDIETAVPASVVSPGKVVRRARLPGHDGIDPFMTLLASGGNYALFRVSRPRARYALILRRLVDWKIVRSWNYNVSFQTTYSEYCKCFYAAGARASHGKSHPLFLITIFVDLPGGPVLREGFWFSSDRKIETYPPVKEGPMAAWRGLSEAFLLMFPNLYSDHATAVWVFTNENGWKPFLPWNRQFLESLVKAYRDHPPLTPEASRRFREYIYSAAKQVAGSPPESGLVFPANVILMPQKPAEPPLFLFFEPMIGRIQLISTSGNLVWARSPFPVPAKGFSEHNVYATREHLFLIFSFKNEYRVFKVPLDAHTPVVFASIPLLQSPIAGILYFEANKPLILILRDGSVLDFYPEWRSYQPGKD